MNAVRSAHLALMGDLTGFMADLLVGVLIALAAVTVVLLIIDSVLMHRRK